jgi:RecA-family ATPase
MIMADFTTDNVTPIHHVRLLRSYKSKLPEFLPWLFPGGVKDGDRFHPYPDNRTHVFVDGYHAGEAFDAAGKKIGSVFDLIRLLEVKDEPEDLIDAFLKTLPPAVPREQMGKPLRVINPAVDWDGKLAPKREWLVEGWLPVGCVTSLYGGAGFGKSLVAQQLGTAVATGRPFFGMPTAQGKVLMVACEDDDAEVQRRQEDINVSLGLERASHVRMGLLGLSGRAGEPNQMAHSSGDGVLRFTPFFQEVRAYARENRIKLLILDNIAQLFGGNENARPEVTQFVNALTGIAVELNCAVLLLGHPGKSTDSEYSGSTAWDAAVRSRWLLTRPKADAVDEVDDLETDPSKLRVLRKAKANYSGTGDEIELAWDQGAFRLDGQDAGDAVDKIETRVRNRDRDARVLAGLRGLLEQGHEPSPRVQARTTYAPVLLHDRRPELRDLSRAAIWKSLNRLMDDGAVVLGVTRGPPSRQKDVLVPAGHPLAKAPSCNGSEYSSTGNFNHHDPYEQPTSRGP